MDDLPEESLEKYPPAWADYDWADFDMDDFDYYLRTRCRSRCYLKNNYKRR